MLTDQTSAAPGGAHDQLRAQPLPAHRLITEGAQIGSKAAAAPVTDAASPQLGTAGQSPFDLATGALALEVTPVDTAASAAAAASSTSHAGSAQAAVAAVSTTDVHYSVSIAETGKQSDTIYTV